MSCDQELLGRIVEGALLSYGEALSVDRLLSLFEEADRPEKQDVLDALKSLEVECQGRGYALVEVASGWRFQVASDLSQWVNRLWDEKPQKYSRALLETLSLIAYRQPLTRSDIEEVRGVAVSSHIIKTLAEREWIKVVGHRDVPGRPSLFATTRQFLDYFGLNSLEELPSLSELKDIESLNEKLQLEDDEVALEQDQIEEAKVGDTSDDEVMAEVAVVDTQEEMNGLEPELTVNNDTNSLFAADAGNQETDNQETDNQETDRDAVEDEENSTHL